MDIPISNCLNADLRRICLLTQFNSSSLHRHIQESYRFDNFSHGFVEILAAAWTPELGVTHVIVEPFAHASDLESRAAELPPALELRAAPIGNAIDLLADVLWRHRRKHGRLPDGLERFADLFG